ncbi:hypothetical protein LTR09_011556 [Extremus antarcticus]|uniref:Nucleoporin NUP49/NSP49 n=1 Tax=Extremus antarcticus TaxID=702011 RepID=A0AAJ0DBN9_9PEZI|nr:hypothetical protein LTR09_011556 [Extremus antarcticus]
MSDRPVNPRDTKRRSPGSVNRDAEALFAPIPDDVFAAARSCCTGPVPELTMENSGSTNGQTSQPPAPAGGLFGRVQTSHPSQQSGGLFGNTNTTSQPQQSGGLFGNATTTSQPQQSGGLFGNSTTSQPQQTGGLFGNATSNTQHNTGGTGLFGGALGQPAQQQQSGGTGLFGSSTTNKPGGLFGSSTTNNAPNNNANNSLFGGGNSLFGGANTQQNQQQASGGMFGGSTNQQQQQAPTNTFMGLTATAPGANQPVSLLGASQYRQPQHTGFGGRLTMGQSASNTTTVGGNTGAQPAQGAVQITYDTMKSTTRFSDLVPEVQQTLERIDSMIQAQERFARQIESFIPKHSTDVESLNPDVELVTEKSEAIETALALDAQGVFAAQGVLASEVEDQQRLMRVIDNLRQPPQFHSRGDDAAGRDMDLIGNFFRPMTLAMEQKLAANAQAIAEVEAHMGILEMSATTAGGRGGFGAAGSGLGSVRELAETLGAFEEGILGAAGVVGQCREGVNELVLGRMGGR